jgi:hypothetical protein
MAASEWVPFAGIAEDQNGTYVLRDREFEGEVVLDKTHVRMSPEKIEIQVGANASVKKTPRGKRPEGAPEKLDDPCEGSGTFCLGSVEFCCHNGEVIGPCDGSWGCS